MKFEKHDGGATERRVLIGMATNPAVLARISLRWEADLFASRWSAIVGGWCVRYFNKHKQPPGKHIASLFETWAEKAKDKETVELVAQFLGHLDAEAPEEGSADYIIELAEKHFNSVKIRRLKDLLEGDLEVGNIDEAWERIKSSGKLEISAAAGIDVLQDCDALKLAFEESSEPIIEYPGPIGEFLNPGFVRDGLFAYMAPSKRGKTRYLTDLAVRAVMQRRRTAYFQVGDLSQGQMERRLAIRIARRPLRAVTIRVPTSIRISDKDAIIEQDEKVFQKPLDWQTAWAAFTDMATKKVKSQESYFKLSVHANSTISVVGIESILDGWNKKGWTADIVVIDYADILAPIDRKELPIQQIDTTWKALRRLSQTQHCLVATASQTNAASFDVGLLKKKHFSGNQLKFAHVTAAAGINQEGEEKDKDITRLNSMDANREFHESRIAYCAGCAAIGNPVMLSALL